MSQIFSSWKQQTNEPRHTYTFYDVLQLTRFCTVFVLHTGDKSQSWHTYLSRQNRAWHSQSHCQTALMAIEQWWFLSVPHLQWHEASVYNGHLWGPVTLTPDAERLAAELSLPDFTTSKLQLGFEHPFVTFSMRGERSNRLPHRGGHECFGRDHKSMHSSHSKCMWLPISVSSLLNRRNRRGEVNIWSHPGVLVTSRYEGNTP